MAFDPEAKLSDVLAGGYHLTAKLLALLDRPLDSRGQEEAMAFSQELSRVFMVSISMLKPDDSKRTLKTKAGDSFGVRSTLPKDNVISRGVTSHKNIRVEEFTRKEVTSSPHKDGYQWQKYGQKNIQNCSFMRHYFRCHDRRCNAKKKVQQQDGSSSSSDAPVFEVTYVNDHTCHVATANDVPNKSPPMTTTSTGRSALVRAVGENTSRNGGGALFDLLHHIGGAEENDAIVSCLAAVISGTPRRAEPSARGDDLPANNVPQILAGRQAPSADGGMAADVEMTRIDTGFSFWPAEAAEAMDLCDGVHMHAARFVDTVWPEYYCT